MGFFDDVGNFFNKAAKTVSNGFKDIGNSGFIKDIGKGLGTVYNDALGIVNKVVDAPVKLIDKGGDVVSNIGKDVTTLGSNLALPIALGIGLVGIVLISKK